LPSFLFVFRIPVTSRGVFFYSYCGRELREVRKTLLGMASEEGGKYRGKKQTVRDQFRRIM
jgi:hypothetical protein